MSKKQLNRKQYWRSLNQLADTDEFRSFVENEFPEGTLELSDGLSRRKFLSLMGASLAFAGLAGCRRPIEKIIPYVISPEDIVPGIPLYYASAMPFGLESIGVLVENHEGRPTKLEGNESHPSSNGKANAFVQASILDLYDPDRAKEVSNGGESSDFEAFLLAWQDVRNKFENGAGENLAVISTEYSSPTLARLKKEFLKAYPNATWVAYEPVNDENVRRGIKMATGTLARPLYSMDKANVILALDSDFLQTESDVLRNAGDFAKGRKVTHENDQMNRLYVAESNYTVTGAMADHRFKMQSNHIAAFVAAVAIEINKQGFSVSGIDGIKSAGFSFNKSTIKALVRDLITNKGKSLILAGSRQPAHVHAIVSAMNEALSNIGETVTYYTFPDAQPSDMAEFKSLSTKMSNGSIDGLIILGGNPVYNAPADFNFAKALSKVEFSVHLSSKVNETSLLSSWKIPESHFLESWNDVRIAQGASSIIQPQIEPLYASVSNIELVSALATGQSVKGYDLVQETWSHILSPTKFEKSWRKVLHDGIHFQSSGEISLKTNSKLLVNELQTQSFAMRTASAENLEVVFSTSASVYDGRFANNGWLQELPDPITKLTWDNAALMSRTTAKTLGLRNEDLVTLKFEGRNLNIPVWIVPGMADYSIGLELGYGQSSIGRIGDGTGVDTYKLRTSSHQGFGFGAMIVGTGLKYELASTQDHNGMDGDATAEKGVQDRLPIIVREATMDEYKHHPEFAKEAVEHPPLISMWEEKDYSEGPQWGMAIDLNVCTGCMACTIACQSENNIPVVGKDQVKIGREMHWMRMDRYFTGDIENPKSVVQPVACQHCEMAPCEQVCPVAATTHTDDGINGMTYNRCVGTRYCANNCPYNVRRFNFYHYTKDIPEIVQMAQNPDVTVRFRGVMEKCTFCLQRVNQAKITSKKNNQTLVDGDVVSACQQTCPTDAIAFGDITDPNSKVSQMKHQNRDYALLGELNTKPRITYQAKLRNPNPELEKG